MRRNLEAHLSGAADDQRVQAPLRAGALFRQVMLDSAESDVQIDLRGPLDLEFRQGIWREQFFRFEQPVDQSLLLGVAH